MDNPVLIVEAPILNDEAAKIVYAFLQNLVLAFESHYYPQLGRDCRSHESAPPVDDLQANQKFIDDKNSF